MHNRLILFTLCSLLLVGCSREDDIEEIFIGKEWHLAGFYQTHDWDNPNMGTPINDYNSHTDLTAYNVAFLTDGTVIVTLPQGCRMEGRWSADGVERTFTITEWNVVAGAPTRLSGYGKLMYDNLRKVAYYQGDSNYIRLFDESRRFFMQFGDLAKYPK